MAYTLDPIVCLGLLTNKRTNNVGTLQPTIIEYDGNVN